MDEAHNILEGPSSKSIANRVQSFRDNNIQMMKSVFYIFSLQTIVASSQKVGNHVGGNHTDMMDESSYLRSLRGNGNKHGKGHNGGMRNGGRAGGRNEMMQTIHNLFDNRGSIMREITQTSDGVETYTYSDDDQVASWIINQ